MAQTREFEFLNTELSLIAMRWHTHFDEHNLGDLKNCFRFTLIVVDVTRCYITRSGGFCSDFRCCRWIQFLETLLLLMIGFGLAYGRTSFSVLTTMTLLVSFLFWGNFSPTGWNSALVDDSNFKRSVDFDERLWFCLREDFLLLVLMTALQLSVSLRSSGPLKGRHYFRIRFRVQDRTSTHV